MADSKISALTDGTTPQATDAFPVARAGTSVKVLWSALKAAAAGSMRNGTLLPTGAIAESHPAYLSGSNITLTSGQLRLVAIYLPTGVTCTSISFVSRAAGSSMTHQYFGLYDSNYNLLRGTNDDTSTAWAADVVKTLNLTSTFVTTYSGLHYLGILYTGSTLAVVAAPVTNVGSYSLSPLFAGGTTSTSLTALPDPAAAVVAQAQQGYGYIS